MMWGYYGGWLWMLPSMLIFSVGLILLLLWVVRAYTGSQNAADPAMETLRRRLAAGEISQDEFEKTRQLLQSRG